MPRWQCQRQGPMQKCFCGRYFYEPPSREKRGRGKFCSRTCYVVHLSQRESIQERFESKCIPEPNSGCWLWEGVLVPAGYGQVWFEGKMVNAHVISHMLYKGPVAKGLHIDHLCRNRMCVNPEHLEAVTPKENIARGLPYRVKRVAAKKSFAT